MSFDPDYHESALTREVVDQMQGPVLLEFGATWCGICAAFTPQSAARQNSIPENGAQTAYVCSLQLDGWTECLGGCLCHNVGQIMFPKKEGSSLLVAIELGGGLGNRFKSCERLLGAGSGHLLDDSSITHEDKGRPQFDAE